MPRNTRIPRKTKGLDILYPIGYNGVRGDGAKASGGCPMNDETLIRVPAAFYRDHDSRDCEPYCEPVKRSKQYVWLRRDDPGLEELLDDARHYADPTWVMEPAYFGLKRSAVATVKAIEEALAKP